MMYKKGNIALLTVDYNSNEDTERLVQSLSQQKGTSTCHVVIVNNAMNKNTVERLNCLEQSYNYVQICHNSKNSGYFGGFNYGLQAVLKNKPEWIIFCNADLIFIDEYFLNKLKQLNIPNDVLCIAPSILTKSGKNQNPFWVNRPSKRRWMMYNIYFSSFFIYRIMYFMNNLVKLFVGGRGRRPSSLADSPIYIYAPHGACFILHRRYFEIYPQFDDHLLLWGEEPILAETVHRVGGRILYVPNLRVMHMESGGLTSFLGRVSYRSYRLGVEVNKYLQEHYVRD